MLLGENMETQDIDVAATVAEQRDEGKPVAEGLVRHVFDWFMDDDDRSGRLVCFRKTVDLPFLVPVGMELKIAGWSGGGRRVESVELDVDTGIVEVSVRGAADVTETLIWEYGKDLLEYGWEILFEEYAPDAVPFADMDEP